MFESFYIEGNRKYASVLLKLFLTRLPIAKRKELLLRIIAVDTNHDDDREYEHHFVKLFESCTESIGQDEIELILEFLSQHADYINKIMSTNIVDFLKKLTKAQKNAFFEVYFSSMADNSVMRDVQNMFVFADAKIFDIQTFLASRVVDGGNSYLVQFLDRLTYFDELEQLAVKSQKSITINFDSKHRLGEEQKEEDKEEEKEEKEEESEVSITQRQATQISYQNKRYYGVNFRI